MYTNTYTFNQPTQIKNFMDEVLHPSSSLNISLDETEETSSVSFDNRKTLDVLFDQVFSSCFPIVRRKDYNKIQIPSTNHQNLMVTIEKTKNLITLRQEILIERMNKENLKIKANKNIILLSLCMKEHQRLKLIDDNLTRIKFAIESANFNQELAQFFQTISPELNSIKNRLDVEKIDSVLLDIKETLDNLKDVDNTIEQGVLEINGSDSQEDHSLEKELDALTYKDDETKSSPNKIIKKRVNEKTKINV